MNLKQRKVLLWEYLNEAVRPVKKFLLRNVRERNRMHHKDPEIDRDPITWRRECSCRL